MSVPATSVPTESREAFEIRINYFIEEVDGLVGRIMKGENVRTALWRTDKTYEELQRSAFLADQFHQLYMICYANIKTNNTGFALEVYDGIGKTDG